MDKTASFIRVGFNLSDACIYFHDEIRCDCSGRILTPAGRGKTPHRRVAARGLTACPAESMYPGAKITAPNIFSAFLFSGLVFLGSNFTDYFKFLKKYIIMYTFSI
jgi:hypothetical protein